MQTMAKGAKTAKRHGRSRRVMGASALYDDRRLVSALARGTSILRAFRATRDTGTLGGGKMP